MIVYNGMKFIIFEIKEALNLKEFKNCAFSEKADASNDYTWMLLNFEKLSSNL